VSDLTVSLPSISAITTFPLFTKLAVEHKASVNTLTSRFEPYSDFTFVNLLTWNMDERTEIALHNGNLMVRLPDYITGDTTMYSLIGDNEVDKSIDELLALSKRLSIVPEVVVRSIRHSSKYIITEDRGSDDYIYDIGMLSSMPGNEFKKKRNKVSCFVRDLGHITTTQTVNSIDKATAEEIRAVFKEWVIDCNKTREECESERIALDRLLSNLESIKVQIMIVRLNDKICAFSVNEVLTDGFAVCHFEKALAVHEGLYSFLIQYAAKELESRGVQRVNWQQDLGLPGLRRAKTSYHPTSLLKKYSITSA
jgi:hypothetical protein